MPQKEQSDLNRIDYLFQNGASEAFQSRKGVPMGGKHWL